MFAILDENLSTILLFFAILNWTLAQFKCLKCSLLFILDLAGVRLAISLLVHEIPRKMIFRDDRSSEHGPGIDRTIDWSIAPSIDRSHQWFFDRTINLLIALIIYWSHHRFIDRTIDWSIALIIDRSHHRLIDRTIDWSIMNWNKFDFDWFLDFLFLMDQVSIAPSIDKI